MDTLELEQKIDAYIAENRTQIIEDLRTIIAFRSVEGPAAPGAPYGIEVRQCLDAALAIANRLGLATNEGDGHVGYAQVPGKSSDYLATVTHLDVVPEGSGWNSEPYTLTEKDGWLIARGTEDDKGPGILCLHAMAFLQQLGVEFPYTMRALLGCNEETGMGDIPYYLQHNPQPLFAFSPDTDFPVCNGEKGLFDADFVSGELSGNITAFSGGIASNVVPDYAQCRVKTSANPAAGEWVQVKREGDTLLLTASGKGGHAAHPAGTVNAIGNLVNFLLENNLCTETENQFLTLLQKLHSSTTGSGLGIDRTDDVFEPLTIIGGIISFENGRLRQNMNSRYPASITGDEIESILTALATAHNATLADISARPPFYIPADSAPIQALMGAYNNTTGRNDKPYTMGGGTYARKFARAVSFGPNDPNRTRPDFVGQIHGANEGIHIDTLLQGLKIYILSLWKLQQLSYE